ncbi:Protein kinase rad3 [Pleurostoma richardsiae]|uniref:Serine/threonine-protein kinase MEC1 n=1 Tax=Pleurostoma richardsiae TaxID=41990 RepID=A0AA38RYU9_9PEZI|nr:Protein kinase rad3 [Pleurostoma richardsiae]
MAPESHSRAGPLGNYGFANGAANGAPPPSTLAAQLVENISASAKSSRPDETGELKRLFSVIEKIKNQPDLLKTLEDRIEHNHMLIYVYARVVLEGPRWDDPFADRAQLKAEVLKAISFMRITIKETPAVLDFTTDGKSFLFRGTEPLWAWLAPKLQRILGHSQTLDLTDAIERFWVFMLSLGRQPGGSWRLCELLYRYLQDNYTTIIRNLQRMGRAGSTSPSLKLPLDTTLDSVLGPAAAATAKGCFYAISTPEHALRHASSLLAILTAATLPSTKAPRLSFAAEAVPWLLDAFLPLVGEIGRWKQHCQVDQLPVLATILELATAYDGSSSVHKVIGYKAHMQLALVCDRIVETPGQFLGNDSNGHAARQLFCRSLIRLAESAVEYRPIARLVVSQILPPLSSLIAESQLLSNGTDFWRCVTLLRQAATAPVSEPFTAEVQPEEFLDTELRRYVLAIEAKAMPIEMPGHASKRRKVSVESSTLHDVVNRLTVVAKLPFRELGSLEQPFLDAFAQMDDADRCLAIDLLAYLPCAADDTLAFSSQTIESKRVQLHCSFCSRLESSETQPVCRELSAKHAAVAILKKLIRLPNFLESRRPRVVAMVALRRFIQHTKDPELYDLETSVMGQWCLQSLQSSLRELRIAAGRTLVLFLETPRWVSTAADKEIVRRNRANALGILKSLSDKDVTHLYETCLMAWGQAGRVVPDEELNLVLVKMLEFLGHRNMIVSAVAFNEILNLARFRRTTPRRLLEPFWRSLAFSAVKDVVSRPQTTIAIAELLQITLNEFLLLIQTHALPWLVLTKKREVVQKIAEARGEKEPWQTCLDNANFGSILALLMIQDVPDVENFAIGLLRHISSHFDGTSLIEYLRADPVPTALELLKASGEAIESRKPLVRNALTMMATMLLSGTKEGRKKSGIIGRFFQQHALGLTTRLTEVINDTITAHPPIQEQKRCLRAMEEMIVLCKEYIRIARPQISACLVSALSYDELRPAAFACWAAMLTHMEDEDVEILIETTFFIIDHYWDSFDERSRQTCKDMILHLLKKNQEVLENTIHKLPSLGHIDDLAELEEQLNALRQPLDNREAFALFAERLQHENSGVVQLALSELSSYLRKNQGYLQASAISEQPDSVVATLSRALMDCASKYNGVQVDISRLCAECVGFVGCLDSNRLETVREHREFVVVQNFDDAEETTDFVAFILQEVLVKSFLSAPDTIIQGFLSYAMQELLDRCDFKAAYAMQGREGERIYRKWLAIPESVREVLTPFMTSRYRLVALPPIKTEYPIFRLGKSYGNWLRSLAIDLLDKGQNPFAMIIFEPLRRVIKVKDLSVAEFLLPYLVVHVIIGQESSQEDKDKVLNELLNILKQDLPTEATYMQREDMKLFCEAVFRVLDYASRWLQRKKALPHRNKTDEVQIKRIQQVLDAIPGELISLRAIDCKQFARAALHLEPYINRKNDEGCKDPVEAKRALDALEHIYTQIDEPDGLEGVYANLTFLDINQQILSHQKAGRWTAAQTWYEVRLAEDPDNIDVQLDLLTCLKESGQYDVLLNYVEGIKTTPFSVNKVVPFAVEASWATGRWRTLEKYLSSCNPGTVSEVFNLGVGSALLCLQQGRERDFFNKIQDLREKVASSMTWSATDSLQACHDAMLKCHVLTDLEIIASRQKDSDNQQETLTLLERRLEVLGAYVSDKQYVLGIRRAAMELLRPSYAPGDISSLWLSSARLARKANSMHQSFNAVLHAHQLGDGSATIENARLLWKQGHPRKAIKILEDAIQTNSFIGYNLGPTAPTSSKSPETQRNLLTARAHLLLAKWKDSAGQTHASALRLQYQLAARTYSQWEKGHYYLGRHYKKVLESEKALKPDEQSDEYLTGETAKLVIENYLRSLNFGTKYLYQTMPRILTLWLELGSQVDKAPDGKVSLSRELHQRRKTLLHELHKFFYKHMQRLPAFIFYTVLPQIVARIAHPNSDVFNILEQIIIKVVEAHPRQALWGLFAIMTTKQPSERRTRGMHILQNLRGVSRKVEGSSYDLKLLLRMGEKLAEQLLLACNNGDFQSNRTTVASITRDLNFNHKCTPCPLVVPIEACLTATLPTLTDNVKKHKAFSRDVITIDSFLDEVLVLGSLAKPRKLTARGSDGKNYGLLIKPKDDLRTDQRLMEFNGMINRSLKRDAESSRRQLYIRTYAVTPLNEECGIIEWVDGLKTLRDILLNIYKTREISPNYGQIAHLMKEACTSEKNISIFTETVLGMFPPVLPSWFVSQFPNPSAWFAARLKYTRSCAVMSMVGTILGLGDRHGENVLLEEGNGGVFHVDFNCLFDKGLTFAQPERVPFRLTHNMVAAMGIYGCEGPFRQCSELTLGILRQQEETLMTILEAFIHDPTLDLQRDKKRKVSGAVRLDPTSVVESIRRKVRGLLPDESIPLGVEGQVEELIKQATDPRNLAAMYIGWCPFL